MAKLDNLLPCVQCLLLLKIVIQCNHIAYIETFMKTKSDASFTMRIPKELLDDIQRIAALSDLSAAQFVRKVLREFLKTVQQESE